MLKAISGLAGTSGIKSQYIIDEQAPTFKAGAWQVQDATRKSTGQVVSVLTFTKSSLSQPLPRASGGGSSLRQATERIVQQLKAEVACLARLRHPALLEVVEPIEETRGSLLFVTERVSGCLGMQVYEDDDASFGSSGRRHRGSESSRLDEVEIQKGLLQLTIGLEFLQSVAGIVHGNLVPDAVFINAKGDWKLGGFSFAVAVKEAATYEPPEQDTRLPKTVQRNLDYAAPEFILDDQIDPLNDMFSLGCLICALVSTKRQSIIQSHQNIHQYRKAIERLSVDALSGVPPYLKQILPQLLTRRPGNRLSANAFQSSPFFDNILMKSIRFLDAFPEKTASERQSFMKGLQGIIPQFPPRVLTKKILPGIMDQFKDVSLLPLILPNVFLIGEGMTPKVFSEAVLPRLKQLFTLSESPGSLSFLLDKVPFLKSKITAYELKEDVMTIVYTALAGDVQYLQEKALKVSVEILQDLDLVTVKTTLFPKVAEVFSHTTMLGTKVTALETFNAMVQHNLDKYTITKKLLPLIKAMKTKEPDVSMAALKLSKSCGTRIDHENIALDILPQLWSMALGPLLSQTQFKQFMSVIKLLSERVEQEQVKKLTDS
ncbi:kinase-like domain-containing protein, partial [Protomyces lactucae-debilis]